MDSKNCRSCNQELPLYKFHVKNDGEKGRNNKCKDCIRASRGQKKRNPPTPRSNEDVTYDVLIEDVFEEERKHPHESHIRYVAKQLRDNPNWQHNAQVVDFIYVMWERRMRYLNPTAFDALDEEAPIMNKHTEKSRSYRKTSLTPYIEYETM